MKFKSMTVAILALSAFGLPATAVAQTEMKCITAAEAQNLISFALPDILSGVINQCKPQLASSAFMITSGPSLLARYQASADVAWPNAKIAMMKMIGDDALLSSVPDQVIKGLLAAGIASGVGKDIKPKDCGTIDRVAEALAPLPPQNASNLIGVFLEMQNNKPKTGSKAPALNICPALTAAK